jgi:DNA-binding response OmpR family regulator
MTKLLIVDDDINLLKFLSDELIEAGFEVKTLENGSDAIVYAIDEPFDLVLLDMLMPGLNGLQVIKVFRKIIPTIPIIGLTGYIGKTDISQASVMGVKILTKPVELKRLIKLVKQTLELEQVED